jgi:hypothetical protein
LNQLKNLGNLCCNIQFAFCDELKAFITGFVRSGNTYTANGADEMIKEIVANIKTDDLEILFGMDSGYFDEDVIATVEIYSCKYLIKGKKYLTLASQVADRHSYPALRPRPTRIGSATCVAMLIRRIRIERVIRLPAFTNISPFVSRMGSITSIPSSSALTEFPR